MNDKRVILALGLFIVCILAVAIALTVGSHLISPQPPPQQTATTGGESSLPGPQGPPPSANKASKSDGNPFTDQITGGSGTAPSVIYSAGEIFIRLLFAVI